MKSIFVWLALFGWVFLAVTLGIGLSLGDVRDPQDQETQRMATVHRLCGVGSALAVMLVNGIVITYFIGTSRWCKEVATTYQLDQQYIRRSAQLKRRTFPITLANMLVVVMLVAFGGAADPAASLQPAPVAGVTWSQIHFGFALFTLAFLGYGSLHQWMNISANQQVIQDVLQVVREVREAKGLEVS